MSLKRFIITNWSLNDGPTIQDHIKPWNKIEEKISQGDKSAGGDARDYLEWILKKATFSVQVKSIIKPNGDYTVGDLFYDVKNRYASILKKHPKKNDIISKFDELEKRTFMGNLLKHDNPVAKNFSIDEIKRFCFSVHDLNKALSCSNCGEFLIYPNDVKRLQCSNAKCSDPTMYI